MVLVEGGTFRMGTARQVTDEEPVHKVTLKGFYIGKYEVTQAEWKAVMGNNLSLYKGDNLPVENITWYDAVAYCNRRSQMERMTPCYSGEFDNITCDFTATGYWLPTEAEWEYACRGGWKSGNYRYSGSNNPLEVAWYEDNSKACTHPVGQLKPNELGIYDMSGNAWEWCWDWYDENYYKYSPLKNPRGPASGKVRVYRGGGAGGYFYWMRCTGRYFYLPRQKHWFIGLRVVKNGPGIPGAKPSEGMVFVKGGSFRMGGSEGIRGERLVHHVTLDSFYIGKYEVTQEEWMAVMGNNPAEFRFIKNPMNFVHWHGAVEYCNKRSRMEGLTPCYSGSRDQVACNFSADGYRLPTESEWEYAARGGLKSRDYQYSGSDDADEAGWYGENSGNRPHPVGQKKTNELGIYDMSGNVWEWCWDWYDFDYHTHHGNPAINPAGPSTGIGRVFRGGSWKHLKAYLRTTFRNQFETFREYSSIGFRVVRTVNKGKKK
jgi:formylglycine-generating enzyme required for sulfatase activity